MKLQTLAVIFVLIILPISIVLSEYIQVQIETLSVQSQYDSQLLNATHDAVVAFQRNTVNNWASTITSSKIEDIEASANVFLTSVANNFKMSGNSKDAIKEYVPAIVYTLYDGYYIYTPFYNELSGIDVATGSTYQNGERTFGLKPYVYYSREYSIDSLNDFVITYSLDNYITIQGKINGEVVNDGGYLIDITGLNDDYDGSTYKNANISNDPYFEYVENGKRYQCVKINGTKYYLDNVDDGYDDGIFYFVQSKRNPLKGEDKEKLEYVFNNINSAREYYKSAYKFTKRVLEKYKLGNLKSSNAKDWNQYRDASKRVDGEEGIINTQANYNIFDNDAENIENYNSGFNQERRSVIKYAIEKNLSASIANFSKISEENLNFQMPKLSEDEWDKVINNVSVISFLQGMNMGNRPYNGYAIVPNNKNEESVGEESIYIVTGNSYNGEENEYHRINDKDLLDMNQVEIKEGVVNISFERKTVDELADDGSTTGSRHFYPRREMACYNSIVAQLGVDPMINETDRSGADKRVKGTPKSVYEYLKDIMSTQNGQKIADVYYTALGRERSGLVKFGLKEKIDKYYAEISNNP